MSRKVLILLCIFILSRVVFINPLPVFFDSPEYLERFANQNYFQAIASGHIPFHSGYIILFWPVFHLANLININPPFAVIFTQTILSAIAIYCFYKLIVLISNKNTALIATLISALTPLYWITNVSIMMDSVYSNFFLISLFLIVKFAKSKLSSWLFLILSCLCFGLAFLTHPLIILWLPLLLFPVYIYKKRKFFTSLYILGIAVFVFASLNIFFIVKSFQISPANGISLYFLSKLGEHAQIKVNILSLFIIARNTIIPLLRNNTTLVTIMGLISLALLLKKNVKIFILGILWITPAIISNQWWDSLLFGRHGTIAGFGFAFLTAIFLQKRKTLTLIVFLYIIIVSFPALILLKQPIPYLEEQKFIQSLPVGLLIESHFARPQIQENYQGTIVFVNEPGFEKEKLVKIINKYLEENNPVFITSQALSDPYGLYSGPYLHTLSLSYAKKFELEDMMSSLSVKKYATIDDNAGLTVYKIISKEKSKYPDIPILINNRHRMDYFDPITQLWLLTDKAKIIQSQSMIKG